MSDAPKATARDVAFDVVRDVFGPQLRGAQAAFDVRARRAGLDARDRRFAAELAYGSIKQRRRIDWDLGPYIGDRRKSLPAAILEVLRLGAYQVRFMSAGEHAAVSETVNLAWRHGHRGTAGLVNAVLRRMLADEPREPQPHEFTSELDFLGTRHSLPSWMAGQFAQSYERMRDAALAGVNAAPQHALTVNALMASRDAVRVELETRGIVTSDSAFVPESLIVDTGALGDDPDGRFWLQGEAAAMPVDLLAPKPGETVLDLCAGRGNKTLQIASRMGGQGHIVAVELDAAKARVLAGRLAWAGATNGAVVCGDAREAVPESRADAVLLDAPCSGTGVIGRHPEARWRKRPEDGAELARAQAELLRAAAVRTASGGRIAYSVCSSDPRECAAVVDAFLAADPSFVRAPLPDRYASFERAGDVVVPAGVEGRDGFYIALLTRRDAA